MICLDTHFFYIFTISSVLTVLIIFISPNIKIFLILLQRFILFTGSHIRERLHQTLETKFFSANNSLYLRSSSSFSCCFASRAASLFSLYAAIFSFAASVDSANLSLAFSADSAILSFLSSAESTIFLWWMILSPPVSSLLTQQILRSLLSHSLESLLYFLFV